MEHNITIKQNTIIRRSMVALAFVWPFVFPHQQLPLGITINALLVVSAVYFHPYERWGIILFPSLAVLLRGMLFGPMTMYMILFAPCIWLGNWLLLYTVSRFHKKYGVLVSGIVGSSIKSSILFSFAHIVVAYRIVPEYFLVSMGYMQGMTALCGTVLAYVLIRLYASRDRRI